MWVPWPQGWRIKKTWYSPLWLQLPDLPGVWGGGVWEPTFPMSHCHVLISPSSPCSLLEPLFKWLEEVFQPLLEQLILCLWREKHFQEWRMFLQFLRLWEQHRAHSKRNQIPDLEPAWSYSYELYMLIGGSWNHFFKRRTIWGSVENSLRIQNTMESRIPPCIYSTNIYWGSALFQVLTRVFNLIWQGTLMRKEN